MIKKKDSETGFRARQIGELTMIPFYFVGGPLVGFVMGSWIDRRFETGPYGCAALMVLGLVAGAREAWRIIRQIVDHQNSSR